MEIFPFLCKLSVHTIAEKHNHYLAVRCPYAQRHRSLNKTMSADETFCRSIFLIWTSNSWLHHVKYEKLQKTQAQVECTKHGDINFK